MDRIVGTLGTGAGNAITFLVTSGIALVIFAALWLAMGAGLIWSQGSLDSAWAWLTGLPWIVQGLVWLLFLPVTVGMWVWQTGWPIVLRLVLIAGLAGWSILIFLPRSTGAPGS